MAAFGSFAGLASAGAGALCSYEANVLNMFDFSPPQNSQPNSCPKPSPLHHHSSQVSQRSIATKDSIQPDGVSRMETFIMTCSP